MENEQDKSTTFFRFEDLRIYHKSLDYIKLLYELASRDALDNIAEHFFVKYLDAAQAISLNIAEGSSRNKSQFIYYLKMAKSSVRECVVYSTTGHQKGYLNDEDFDVSKNYLMEMTKMIGALIGSLQRSTKDPDSDSDNGDPNSY
jgi:four helix bundle protein